MYLLVIVTLVISLLGVYAQTLTLQAARFAASQNGLALTMMMWHDAALSMGASIVDTGQQPLAPCSLTYTNALFAMPFMPAMCPPPVGAGMPSLALQPNGTVTGGGFAINKIFNMNLKPAPAAEDVHLPVGYQASVYQFYSLLYHDVSTGHPYIVTFVQPDAVNPSSGLLVLPPAGTQISLSANDLIHQLKVSGLPNFSYGTVQTIAGNKTLVTSQFQYVMPKNGGADILNNGAVALISSPAGF